MFATASDFHFFWFGDFFKFLDFWLFLLGFFDWAFKIDVICSLWFHDFKFPDFILAPFYLQIHLYLQINNQWIMKKLLFKRDFM